MEMFYESKDMIRCLNVVYNEMEHQEIMTYDYQIKMIEVNQIPFLLDTCVIDVNHKSELRFLTKNCHVFSNHFRYQKMDGEIFRTVIDQIFKCIDVLSLYLLSTENLVLNPDYMFFDVEEQSIQMVYIPGYNKDFKHQLKLLLEYMMRVFDSTDRDGIQQLYHMYNEIGMDTWGSDFFERIQQADGAYCDENTDLTTYASGMRRISQNEGYKETLLQYYPQSYNVKDDKNVIIDSEETIRRARKGISKKISELNVVWLIVIGVLIALVFFSLSVFLFINKNVFLLYVASAGCILLAIFCAYLFSEEKENADEAMEEYLRRTEENKFEPLRPYLEENIISEESIHALVPLTNGSLGEIVFSEYGDKIVVGRGRNEADYRLSATAISRVHAYILQREGGIFLEDMASQNGTFLNSVRIPSNEIKKLNRGDIVGFANEEFFVS